MLHTRTRTARTHTHTHTGYNQLHIDKTQKYRDPLGFEPRTIAPDTQRTTNSASWLS